MEHSAVNEKEELHNKKQGKKGTKLQIMAWMLVGTVLMLVTMLIGGSYAWYSVKIRETESKTVDIMKPYYLTLLNPSETDSLQLAVGSLMPGKKKQVVFCVSNKNNEQNDQINMGGSDFAYSIELVYTNNLALEYEIYGLQNVDAQGSDTIVTNDTVIQDGEEVISTKYWKKDASALNGIDVSKQRQEQMEVSEDVWNKGTYISYEENDQLYLMTSESGYASQYFVLEISWKEAEGSNFEKYEKETDMIYLLVKALQPEPVKNQ